MKRAAIIDMGSNTFNLLIADFNNSTFNVIHEAKLPVQIGAKGYNRNFLSEDAIKRAISALNQYHDLCIEAKCSQVIPLATSAIRTAQNRQDFVNQIKEKFNWDIEVIDGAREAELIGKGVLFDLKSVSNGVIMDIGGGSTEFILFQGGETKWLKSYPLGVSRILEKFSPSDPSSQEDKNTISTFLDKELEELYEVMSSYKIENIIGASGSFETFYNTIFPNQKVTPHSLTEIPIKEFTNKHHIFWEKSTKERKQIKGMMSFRAPMIHLSSILVERVLFNTSVKKLYFSSNSMKEGKLVELINNLHDE